jgi:hypothetical protein
MIRFIGPILVLAIDIYALVDVILTDPYRIKSLNKFFWVVIILLLPLIGAILWFAIGKEHGQSARPQQRMRAIGPDDDPAFLRNARRLEEQDERIRRLEQELADLDDDKPKE